MGHAIFPRSLGYLFVFAITAIAGCAGPSKVNVELRKKVQTLEDQVSALRQQTSAQQQMIAGLQNSRSNGAGLPAAELQKLYVAYGIKIARMTGSIDLDPQRPGDEAVRVYAQPVDENGSTIQAAGTMIVEAFDLDLKGDNRLGRWEFPTPASKQLWRSLLMQGVYELTCPWQKAPVHPNLTIKLTFIDELTKATFTAEKLIQVTPPGRERFSGRA